MNRVGPCAGCRAIISVDAKACPHCGKPAAGRTPTAAIVIVAINVVGGLIWWFSAHGGRPEVYVQCQGAGVGLAAGLSCSVDHRSGSSKVDVCWTVNISCANGLKGSGDSCGEVSPGSQAVVLMPYARFGTALDKCDQVSRMSVDDVRIK